MQNLKINKNLFKWANLAKKKLDSQQTGIQGGRGSLVEIVSYYLRYKILVNLYLCKALDSHRHSAVHSLQLYLYGHGVVDSENMAIQG